MATDAIVTITYDSKNNELTIDKPEAYVYGPGSVTWVAEGATASIVITFGKGCPFPSSGGANNPSAGEYVCAGASITTAPASSETNGPWSYTASLQTTDRGAPSPANGTVVVSDNP